MYFNTDILGHTLIIEINGELDDHGSKRIREKADFFLYRKEIKNIIFDLTQLELMDSSGIGLLMGRFKTIKERNGRCAIVIKNEKIKKILSISGILGIYECFENYNEAIKIFNS